MIKTYHDAFIWVIVSLQQLNDSTFSTSARSYQGNGLASLDLQIEIF